MTLDKHAPIKKKMARGDEASSMTKDLSKTIMNRPKIKYRYTNDLLVKMYWHLKSRRMSVTILTKR